jgi:pimeloyl-ACP methyl ester carboxylesterase
MRTTPHAPRLDPNEQHFRIPGPHPGLSLFLRYLPPAEGRRTERHVIYVHGGTFPSGLSVAHRIGGWSWRDSLCAAGFHVWTLDFHGFGGLSDPYPQMAQAATASQPLGRTGDASRQLEAAMLFIRSRHGNQPIGMIAHSWGSMVAGEFAGRCADMTGRMVWFGPIARRAPRSEAVSLPGWRLISLQDQWNRFTETVPRGEPPVLSRTDFAEWGERYLDCDPDSRTRSPAAVKVPSGAFQDIFDAWAGRFPYDPAAIRSPVAIIRGAWDGMCGDADAAWLRQSLTGPAEVRDIVIPRATHLMHLESGRHALYRETEAFLAAH